MKKLTLTASYLQECFKRARYYEFCKETEKALSVLQPVWMDIEKEPDIEGLSDREAWETLLICGSLLSVYGTANQLKNYGERAADTLTRARELAIVIGERELIAEAEKQMAIAYWRLGEFENAVAFLNTVLSKYSEAEQVTDPICLLAQANLLLLFVKIGCSETAVKTIKKINPFVDESDDLWLKTGFYNQAAGVYVLTGNYKQAIPFLEKAIEFSILAKNNTYLGCSLNNLSNAYLNLSLPNKIKAMEYVDNAINLFMATNQLYPYAIALETKATLTLDAGDSRKALLLINESIEILQKGENYSELCDSLWTRTKILVKQSEIKQAIRQFSDLLSIANQKLSLLDGNNYIERFSKLIYLPVGDSLEEKEKNFRHFLLDEALKSCGGIVTTTANYLGVMHQTLSAMLKKFPELCRKHQVKLRTRSSARAISAKQKAEEVNESVFAIQLTTDRLEYLGLHKGTIIEIRTGSLDKLDLSKPVVIQDLNKKFHCGFLVNAFDMLAFEDGRGNIERTFVPAEIIFAGQIIRAYDENNGVLWSFVKR